MTANVEVFAAAGYLFSSRR